MSPILIPVIISVSVITFSILLYCITDLCANISVYGERLSKFKSEYGYIKDTIDCGILISKFMYPWTEVKRADALRFGRMYKSCFHFLRKYQSEKLEYDLDKLKEKYFHSSKNPFTNEIIKILKKNKNDKR